MHEGTSATPPPVNGLTPPAPVLDYTPPPLLRSGHITCVHHPDGGITLSRPRPSRVLAWWNFLMTLVLAPVFGVVAVAGAGVLLFRHNGTLNLGPHLVFLVPLAWVGWVSYYGFYGLAVSSGGVEYEIEVRDGRITFTAATVHGPRRFGWPLDDLTDAAGVGTRLVLHRRGVPAVAVFSGERREDIAACAALIRAVTGVPVPPRWRRWLRMLWAQ